MADTTFRAAAQHRSLPGNAVIYWLLRAVCLLLFRLLTRYRVTGRGDLPTEGPLLVVTNHLHRLDPPLIMATLPYRMVVMAADKYERTLMGLFLRGAGAIFVRRGEVDRIALRRAQEVLAGGGVLGIAPEGTRSPTSALQEGKKGAAFLAYRAGVPILPVALWGVEKVPHALLRLRRAPVHVAIGPAFMLPPVQGKPSSEDLQRATDLIMCNLARLLPEQYRGVYQRSVAGDGARGAV